MKKSNREKRKPKENFFEVVEEANIYSLPVPKLKMNFKEKFFTVVGLIFFVFGVVSVVAKYILRVPTPVEFVLGGILFGGYVILVGLSSRQDRVTVVLREEIEKAKK